jgi:hypothetical protein
MKIASPELNHDELLEETASYGLPTLLSSGVSRLSDIERALERFPREDVCLLHCVTAYPAPPEDYNLRVLGRLAPCSWRLRGRQRPQPGSGACACPGRSGGRRRGREALLPVPERRRSG